MSKQKSILIFIVLVFILFLFWKKRPDNSAKEPRIESSVPQEKQSSPLLVPTPNKTTPTAYSKKTISQEVVKCLPEASDVATLDDLYSYIQKTESLQEETPEEELWHFADKEGQQLRAQLLYFKDKKEFKLFRVHKDGLPDPIPLTKEESFNPSSTILSKYIPSEITLWYQKKVSIKTAKESILSIEFSNSSVTKLDYSLQGKSIHCAVDECFCASNSRQQH